MISMRTLNKVEDPDYKLRITRTVDFDLVKDPELTDLSKC